MTGALTWIEANRRWLAEEVARVLAAIEGRQAPANREPWAGDSPAEPAIERLCSLFRLSQFERAVVVACAGVELDSRVATACTAAQGAAGRPNPTFSLLLGALPGAHWSAVSPGAPLRYWRLIELGGGETVTSSPLRIDERILHFLTGTSYLDERLQGLVEPFEASEQLPPSHNEVAGQAAAVWSSRAGKGLAMPAIQFCGEDPSARQAVAAAACGILDMAVYRVWANLLPASPADALPLIRLLEREAALSGAAILLECDGIEPNDPRQGAVGLLINTARSPLMLSRGERVSSMRPIPTFEVARPLAAEQQELWRNALGAAAAGINGHIETVVSQFSLGAASIRAAAPQCEGGVTLEGLWEICRAQARPRLENLAQRIVPTASWDDLVLPDLQRAVLSEIAAQVRQRSKVYGAWGFASRGERGLGISAMFAGASGTGKTLAAEVLAGALALDLYRIDLSQVVSKYIGETEKNLRQIFSAAEEGGAVLFFDEADALFGKRSEVKDSHDRYANIEIAYLLQRMESYRGLAVLATNMKAVLDPAFLRRIRFVVPFPFPDATMRAEIWRRIFPAGTPTEGLDATSLGRLSVPGGNIRNIALNGAFLAAEAGTPVRMCHLLAAARQEYSKLEKPLTESEIGGWV
jgi:hypothetical protein